MSQPSTDIIRVLHLEDNPLDAELIHRALRCDGLNCSLTHVRSRKDFESMLERECFDVILADYSVPGYDGFTALNFARQRSLGIPFILLSGTIGEEQAVESLKSGATDYILKQRLTRLGPAIRRALDDARRQAESQRAEQRIREQAALLDAAQDGILVCDLEGTIRFWNRGAEVLYEWKAEEVIGRKLDELLFADAKTQYSEAFAQTCATGKWAGETKQLTKSRRTVVADSSWTLVKNESGQPSSILVINTDFTEQKQLEEQYLRAQRLESVGILASGIAHDLNNVLAPILMGAQLLRMTINDPQAEESLSAIENSAQHGADLIKQILAFGRGVSGERVETPINHLIRDVHKLIAETFPRSVEIRVDIPRDLWTVKAVGTQIHQVLMNLCVNARDAMPNGGRLDVRAENLHIDEHYATLRPEAKVGPYVVITVTDTGTGISPETMQRIYDPFFTTKEIGKGTGLGLSTVKSIVKNHEGFIHVYSELGKGTRFRIYFPAVGSMVAQDGAQQQKMLPRGRGETLLVVDDEPDVRQITASTLIKYGYRVITAKDGADGLATYVANQQEIAVVLTDMMMPLMGGSALIRALRRMNPAIRIVALSGMADSIDERDLAGVDLIPKPFSTEDLLVAVDKLLPRQG